LSEVFVNFFLFLKYTPEIWTRRRYLKLKTVSLLGSQLVRKRIWCSKVQTVFQSTPHWC